MFGRVAGSLPGQAFDQYRRGNHRRPQALGAQGRYQRGGPGRAFGKARDRARIQDQHPGLRGSAGLRRAPGGYPPRDGLGAGLLLRGGLAHLLGQAGQVDVGLSEQVLAVHLGPHRLLQEF